MPDIRQIAREADTERYICSLCADPQRRKAIWATIALMHELLKIPATVSEQMVGMIRVKWWQEQLEHLATKDNKARRDHPVLLALADISLPKDQCDAVCEAVMQQCGETNLTLSEAQHALGACYQLLSHAAGEEEHNAIYEALGNEAALIATIRVNVLKSGWSAASEIMYSTLSDCASIEAVQHSGFLCALKQHNELWKQRITASKASDEASMLKHIPFFALRVLWKRVFK